MQAIYLFKPSVKIRLWDEVYTFDQDGRLCTENEELQAAIETSELYQTGQVVKEGEPLRYAVKIYSPILEGYLWVVQDRKLWPHLKEGGEPVYDAQEINELKSLDSKHEELKAVHMAKKTFPGAKLEKAETPGLV